MPEVTLKAIEQLFDKRLNDVATKKDLAALATVLDRVAAHTAVLAVDVPEIKAEVKAIRATVDFHTNSIEYLVTRKDTKDHENTIRQARFERALRQVGEHLNLKLEL